jgi:hypothetical protein
MTGHIALLLIDKEGDVFLKASTTRPDIVLAHDEVLIKDYTENTGIIEPLQRAGVIGPKLREDVCPVHKLLLCVPPKK